LDLSYKCRTSGFKSVATGASFEIRPEFLSVLQHKRKLWICKSYS